MLKRKNGFLLLIMLVLTGLGGRLHTDTLVSKERNLLIHELKNTRSVFLKSFAGLSHKQINFQTNKKTSIKEIIFNQATTEYIFWENVKSAIAENHRAIEKSINYDLDIDKKLKESGYPMPMEVQPTLAYHSIEKAIEDFKVNRKECIEYVQTVTDNPRLNYTSTSIGKLNIYQAIMLSSKYSKYYTSQIELIKASKKFPKQ